MNCTNVQKLLLEYAECTVTGRRRSQIELHLFQCEACRAELSRLQELREDISSLEEPGRKPQFWEDFNKKLSQRLERETTVPARYSSWIPRLAIAAATATILIVLTLLALSRLQEWPPVAPELAAVPAQTGGSRTAPADSSSPIQADIRPSDESDFSSLYADDEDMVALADLSSEEIDEVADGVGALVGEDWGWASDEVALDDIYEQNMYDVLEGLTPEEFAEIYQHMESI